MMGERRVQQEALFYEFSLERHVPEKHFAAVNRSLRRTRRAAAGIGAVLQRDGSAIDRPGAADSHADRRLLLWYPLGAATVRGGAPQPGVSLVLWIGSRRRSARSLDLLEEPARPLPRQRFAATLVRDGPATVPR